jgi:Carboxypeptidase regulatory-like domain/TonB-dependent Receptor Plug Domain
MKRTLRLLTSMAAVAVVLTMQIVSNGQEATGKIIGTVTDPQGAVIPGAKITATNTGNQTFQVSREAVTDENGAYQIPALPIGTYRVTIERDGFKKFVSDGNKLQINQILRVEASLELGSPSEVVDVTGQAVAVETVNPTLGRSVTSRPISDLPLNGRNVLNLALLQPGVSENNSSDTGAGTFNIGGGRADSVTFLLDGGLNNNLLSNRVVFNPNPDTVAEFRILTSNYTAEYGRNAGGIISVVTKSGTNELSFSLFEFLRNDALNANSFFNNRDGLPRDILKRHQFGGTVSGPIFLPRLGEGGKTLWDGRNKAFFFFSYQGQRQKSTTTTSSITVFTPAELNGDFSHSNSTRTGPDTRIVSFLNANPQYQPNPALRAQGIIDPLRINSVARNYINAGLIPTSASGILKSQGAATSDNDEYTAKLDFNIREKDKLAITLGRTKLSAINPFSYANVPGYPTVTGGVRQFANIGYTSIFSSSLINDFRFTAQRDDQTQSVPTRQLPNGPDLGINVISDHPTGPVNLNFGSGMGIGFSVQGPTNLINNTFNWSDTVSMIKGSHSFKFGGDYGAYQNNTVYDFYVNGEFTFSGSAAAGGIGSGNDLADFLFGLPDEYFQFGEAPSDIRSKSFSVFFQDEWRVRKNLNLTLGVRYEYNQPKYDTRGRSFSIVEGKKSTRFPNAPTGLLFPGDADAPKGANFSDFNDLAPRFGFAWDPFGDAKTSIRGGFGVFYDVLKGEDNLQFNGQAPFFGFADLFMEPGPDAFSDPFGNVGQPNPFPSRPPAQNIDFDAAGFLPFGGGGVYFVDPHLRTPYNYQYNLSIQRELHKDLIAEISYVGSSSHGLTALVDRNPFILGTFHRVLNTSPGNDDFSFSYIDEFRNAGAANYNSMQLSLTKGLSETAFLGRTYFTLGYTWAHSIDTASGFRNRNSRVPAYDNGLFRADSDYDIRHRFTFSGGWDLPFDRMWKSGPKALVQGWSIYPIFTYRTGFPLDVNAGLSRARNRPGPSAAGDSNLVHANLTGPIVLLDPHQSQTFGGRTGNYYFNPAIFTNSNLGGSTCNPCVTNPALRTYGSLPRNAFRGPSRTNLDFSIGKVTPLFGERLKMEFRAEFFNILNSVQFRDPSTSITAGTFGLVSTTYDPRIIQFGLKLLY